MLGIPPSPRRRKLRVGRGDETPDDLVLVIRASPATRPECIADLVADAVRSGRVYAVAGSSGRRQVLFGVSVFARRPGVAPIEVLARFDAAPAYLEGRSGPNTPGEVPVRPSELDCLLGRDRTPAA